MFHCPESLGLAAGEGAELCDGSTSSMLRVQLGKGVVTILEVFWGCGSVCLPPHLLFVARDPQALEDYT